jgi:secretion/DNA translocation related TadE-like protein
MVLAIGFGVVLRDAAVLGRHRAESAADLAALAAAQQIGTGGAACEAARRVAERNGARLIDCRCDLAPDGRSGTVGLRVQGAVGLPVVGTRQISATARAGRLPG